MVNMSQINHIKDLARAGHTVSAIARQLNLDPKTVRKYIEKKDFSPRMQKTKRKSSILDPYRETIDQWLLDDQSRWQKQHHTAQRIHDRLQEHFPAYSCSYPTVVRYVRKKHQERQDLKYYQELVWHPGEAQADFGEMEVVEQGQTLRKKCLILSFPYSNDSLSQVFGGETAECVCQGLKDIFAYIGGVPSTIVFDNATGVGRRIGQQIHESQLFASFRAHYDFNSRFCNPNAGHEKGHVENKVNYTRHNLFVPPPVYSDIEGYNQALLDKHRIKANDIHYKKGVVIHELFEADRQALYPLPAAVFDVCRYQSVTADKYGKVCLDARHYYSTCPEYGGRSVLLGILAHSLDVYTPQQTLLVRHKRQFRETRTDNMDVSTSLAVLTRNIGAWPNSGIREQMPPFLRDELDKQARDELRQSIRTLQVLSKDYGYGVAIQALEEGIKIDRHNFANAAALAARISGYGLTTHPAPGPDLQVYDRFLGGRKP